MNTSAPDDISLDALVAQVVDEFRERQQRGEQPDVEEYAARHPDAAPLLRKVLAAFQLLGGSLTGAADQHAVDDEPLAGTLGDFRLVREIGRGGMGIVYEAEQISLSRRVALKVLPFASTLDAKQLQRFKNEAQAAANLHHTNIVPVFATGCERGVHFYAMQFIQGQTLADVIADLRLQIADLKEGRRERVTERKSDDKSSAPTITQDHQIAPGPRIPLSPRPSVSPSLTPRPSVSPSTVVALSTERSIKSAEFFRTVARLGVQAAEALEYAHSLGVVHRDIKPANLLLDALGNVWIADFGLAHCQNQAGLTMSGDLVGTLRYMSPEQALAKRVLVDHRTDVYSLGATLYELLTLEPVFTGQDRQELLRQIAFEEPKPPRRLNKAIPAELETIVLKALEKNPADRYATAQDLADDLQRLLADEPIRARRPRVVQRLRKWSRRHKPVVAALAALVLTTLILGSAAAWWRYSEESARQRATAARERETERGATEALVEAKTLLTEGDKQLDNPARWQATVKLAESAVKRAENVLATGVGTEELEVRVQQVREAVNAALTDSQLLVELDRIQLEKTAVKEGHYDWARAAALYKVALRGYGVDPAAPAEAAARVRGSRLREALLAALEDSWLFARRTKDEAQEQRVEAVLLAAEPARDAFRARWRAALRRRDGAALARMAGEPEVQNLPLTAVLILGHDLVHDVKEWPAAERLLRTWQERYPGNFWLNHDMGLVLLNQKRPQEAARYLTAALALRSDSPGVYLNLGNALKNNGDVEGAIRCYQAALRIDPKYAAAHNNLGNALEHKGDIVGAMREYQAALKIDPKLAEVHINVGTVLYHKGDIEGAIREYQVALKIDPKHAGAHYGLGLALEAKGDIEGAIRCYEAALRIDPKYAEAHSNLGATLFDKGDIEEAIRCFRAALQINPKYAAAHNNLGVILKHMGDIEGAIRACQAALQIDPKYAEAHSNLGATLFAKGDLEGAIRCFQAALKIDPKHALAHNNLGNALKEKGDIEGAIREYQAALKIKPKFAVAHNGLGAALSDKGDIEGAIREYQVALQINPKFAMAHNNLGLALSAKGDIEGAIREHQAALKIKPKFAEANYNLGHALYRKGDVEGAVRCCLAVLRIDPKFAAAHNGLGIALAAKGDIEGAIRCYQAALKIEPKLASAHRNLEMALKAVRKAEQLSKVLKGDIQPADAAERLQLASLCMRPYKQLNAAAVRFYADAFAAEPKLAEDLGASHRYDAACAAALAGCGKGKDAPAKEPERARLRRQALDWLRADLTAYRQQLDKDAAKARPSVLKKMQHWQRDRDFAGVRGPEALAQLPESERQEWQKLWEDVAALHKRAARPD